MQNIKTVLITGASGLIGTQLSQMLSAKGYIVLHLGRKSTRKPTYPTFFWDVENGEIDTNAFKNVDAIVHLAGAGVADSRWTEDRKRQIINSRVNSGRLLHAALKNTPNQVKVFVAASAVGYYGNRYQEVLTETAQPTNEFLSRTTQNWEDASVQMAELDIRTVILRIGIVLSEKGGALPQTALPLKMRVGAYFGSGKQYYSWIHIDDVCRAFIHALQTPAMSGVYNAVAPKPVTNKEFVRNIAVAMGKPAVFVPTPAFALQLAMGEMSHLVLDSAYVSADKLLQTGFTFEYPQIELALKEIYQTESNAM